VITCSNAESCIPSSNGHYLSKALERQGKQATNEIHHVLASATGGCYKLQYVQQGSASSSKSYISYLWDSSQGSTTNHFAVMPLCTIQTAMSKQLGARADSCCQTWQLTSRCQELDCLQHTLGSRMFLASQPKHDTQSGKLAIVDVSEEVCISNKVLYTIWQAGHC